MSARLGKIDRQIADVIGAGGWVRCDFGTRSSTFGRAINLTAFELFRLFGADRKPVRKLTRHQVERAIKHRILACSVDDLPRRNVFGDPIVIRIGGDRGEPMRPAPADVGEETP